MKTRRPKIGCNSTEFFERSAEDDRILDALLKKVTKGIVEYKNPEETDADVRKQLIVESLALKAAELKVITINRRKVVALVFNDQSKTAFIMHAADIRDLERQGYIVRYRSN